MEIRGPGREVAFKGTLTPSIQFKDMCHQGHQTHVTCQQPDVVTCQQPDVQPNQPEKRRRIEVSQCQVTAPDTCQVTAPDTESVEEAPQTQPTVEDLNEINDFIDVALDSLNWRLD